ncbi:23S rRNA (pseudouridine(1915)-N(3))-methyltransferase RlmH [Marinifilum caeruleilacunae]|uniref:Ribosomal RNA large subunit methyltransferase H n=1 Tax=Marinifilum caeruleilacunae TaxID=2499076 RepID=A0ABX1WZ42_9BACT|nr:23S rRNA (pseudouridine(1915)-N(3))-methyltransferase RlmH [Marinifilum caeruleilacunae]NOU61159.1 23S rRNA (pseudouridine(1915)-N(3))-methyltransferase RlmH [Marinifilum caeruleilacunae]
MKATLLVIGKTDKDFVKKGIDEYQKRLVHYLPFEFKIIPDIKNTKNLSENQQKQKEGDLILDKLKPTDTLILLDENGKEFSSVGFSKFMEQKMISGTRNLVFVIGGPYGFSDDVYKKAQGKVSLSKMTFSHQMIRMIFTEQLYRAMTIIKGEPYHHV